MNETIDIPADLPAGESAGEWLDWTAQRQSLASDPASSAWVSANAGSGKTHVLTQRVIRLLLAGSRPSAILCLTYTKAAASEMSNRVFERLAEWAIMGDAELADRIASIEGAFPDAFKLAEARRLFARALETPGGLKIQTIHAFCEALLHQFPLEANIPGHFSVLDDRASSVLLADARRSLLTATASEDDSELAQAFEHVLALGDEFGLETLLGDIVANRSDIRAFLNAAEKQDGAEAALRQGFGLEPQDTEKSAAMAYWPLAGLEGPTLDFYLELADKHGGVKVQDIAYALRLAAKEVDPFKRADYLDRTFLTLAGKPKADTSLIAKAMSNAAPDLPEAVAQARDHITACRDRLALVRLFEATRSALVLADRLDRDYNDLKKRRSQLDFEDLIARTADLLTREDVGPWIHYKLDQGIDHILVDEAQDTSPVQWKVIQSLASDFHSGRSARETLRTIFAVGDEKQSIYSFQGARPERFSQERAVTERRVRNSDQHFHAVRLPLSFRSTEDILSAVDQVFSVPENMRGLSAVNDPVVHRSNRIGHPGEVDVWDIIAPEAVEDEDDWTAPFDATPEGAPSAILARRIAFTISRMIGHDTIIEKDIERPIQAGDILVLVRKRDGFVNALTRALKKLKNVPVAGADRLALTSHIAVQDLLALGRFLILHNDDLSLCAVLKSPLFEFSEEDVFTIATTRAEGESVWRNLIRLGDGNAFYARAVQRLQLFADLSRTMTVYDFFGRVLGLYNARRDFLARLGSEANDILDEFLAFALDYEDTGLPGMQAFISTLEIEAPQVKRELGKERNEVRIMTVHASKGLEAPVVFLVDGSSKAFSHTHLSKFRLIDTPAGKAPIWLASSALSNSLAQSDLLQLQQAAEEEYRRLLYVGMTRAADRLIVCGYRGKTENTQTWHSMIAKALLEHQDHCRIVEFNGPDGSWGGLSWRIPKSTLPIVSREKSRESGTFEKTVLPAELMSPLPAPDYLPRPLSPSEAGIMVDDEVESLIVTSPLFGEKHKGSFSLQRGRLVHRMLQMLPSLHADDRRLAAERYMERAARFWPQEERQTLVQSVMAVLESEELRPAFSPNSRAEVSVMGTLRFQGRQYAVSGRLDRMAVANGRVIILDYKTDRTPPANAGEAHFAHKAQLAIYREVLAPLYPGMPFDCLLVYTTSGVVLRISDEDLRDTLAALKTK